MTTLRFASAQGLSRYVTVTASPVRAETAARVVQSLFAAPSSAAHASALDQLAAEAFPRHTWRTRVVNPRRHLGLIEGDLLVEVVRALCPAMGVTHGL